MSRTKIPFPVRVPFVESLGLELHACAHGASELRVDLADAHMNSWEVAHGGVLMTMLDVSMAHAARSVNTQDPAHAPGLVTVEMKTSFMRPGQGRLAARARVLHRSTTMAFCEASVFDEDHHLCAHATGTFKYLRKLPVKGRGVKALQRTNPDTP